MSKLRTRAATCLVTCASMMILSVAVSLFLVTGKDDSKKASAGSAVAGGVSSAAEVKPGDTGSAPALAESSPTEESSAASESAVAETDPLATLAEQPATLFEEGQQPDYKTPADANMNLRAGPGTDFDKVAQIPMGTTVTALGSNADGSWVVVQYNGKCGWLAKEYLE